jgi:hypothetical protein
LRAMALSAILSPWAVGGQSTDPWSKADIAWEVAYQTLLVADWAQTRRAVCHSATIHADGNTIWIRSNPITESNPLLGSRPSRRRVDTHFALSALGHIALIHFLPARYRRIIQAAGVGIQIFACGHNLQAGVSIRF